MKFLRMFKGFRDLEERNDYLFEELNKGLQDKERYYRDEFRKLSNYYDNEVEKVAKTKKNIFEKYKDEMKMKREALQDDILSKIEEIHKQATKDDRSMKSMAVDLRAINGLSNDLYIFVNKNF